MTERLVLTHTLAETLDRPVRFATHWLRLHPAPGAGAPVDGYRLAVAPRLHFLNWLRDPYGNRMARLDFPEPVKELALTVEILLRPEAAVPPPEPEPWAAHWPFAYPQELATDLAPYLTPVHGRPELPGWLEAIRPAPGETLAVLEAVAAACAETSDPEVLIALERDPAWTRAWLANAALRHLGLAARFVSGYRLQAGGGLTAWCEVFLPGSGWLALDPESGRLAGADLLALARVPEPLAALPVEGYREAARACWHEAVRIAPLAPAVRSPEADIEAAEHRVAARIGACDLRLATARELVFTATRPGQLAEWRFAADGEDKRARGRQLLAKLQEALAPDGVLHSGQGEWYAGEPVPRWCWRLCWRADGTPLRPPGLPPPPQDPAEAREILARALRIDPRAWLPAFEDPLAQAGEPTPPPSGLATPEARLELAERLSPPGEVRGWVLPLAWDPVRAGFRSGSWRLRRSRLYLLPGGFPIGYRLPLGSLPQAEAPQFEPERDPFESYQFPHPHPLSPWEGEASRGVRDRLAAPPLPPEAQAPRTALALEVRAGRLHVFLPPLAHLEAWLELLAAVSLAFGGAALEGYPPPEDPRLACLKLTPEAGTLRLGLPPTRNPGERRRLLEAAYAAAQACGLAAERGGELLQPAGNGAQVLGGETPAVSPFLRCPGLVRSLVVYFQHHPSLAYAFAGPWIGPDGPAPRPDEGRPDALYELSLALERLRAGENFPPWRADRVLRHLLAAPDGDVRRAEISIARLYPPERAALRRGELILNAFATPPDAFGARLQALLVEALLARLAASPYHLPLKSLGQALTDRFLLPAVLWEDFQAVLADLNAHDLPLRPEWFLPLFERRFPKLAGERLEGLGVELRPALEPWPLLAETFGVRYLDSANARVQVRVDGLVEGRHLLLCNGLEVPLARCGDGHVAGVRYKAGAPPWTLNPLLEPVAALRFEVVDRRQDKVLGGIDYAPGAWQPPPPPPPPSGIAGGLPAPLPLPPVPPPLPAGHPRLHRFGARPLTEPPQRTAVARPYLLDLTRRSTVWSAPPDSDKLTR